jgi:hypothetical protein
MNVAFADVIAPAESRVRSILKVPVPVAVASAFVTGGTSFAGLSAAVNVTEAGGVEGVFGLLLPHPAASSAAAAIIANLFILSPPDGCVCVDG